MELPWALITAGHARNASKVATTAARKHMVARWLESFTERDVADRRVVQ